MGVSRLLFLWLISFSWIHLGHAQIIVSVVGSARAAALGHATTALPNDLGTHANPAAVVHKHRILHFFVREAYGLSELRLGTVDLVYPFPTGAVFGGAGTFGFDAYRESYVRFGGARGFTLGTSRSFRAGIEFRYYHTSIPSYGQAGTLGLIVGAQVRLLPTLTFGTRATNLNAPQLADGEDLPRTLAVGLAYEAASRLTVLLDTVKDIDFPLSIRGGVETQIVRALAFRVGITTRPTRFTAGAGLRLGAVSADLAAEQHQDLGWSPSIGLGLRW